MYRSAFLLSILTTGAAPAFAQEPEISQRAMDALIHVVAHEIGHAFIREFDLPIMGPEEAIADDFATVYVHLTFPERAMEIVTARAAQNLADGEDVGMFSEYMDDDWRAGRSVCLLYGLDPDIYEALLADFEIDDDVAATCRDFAPEVGRSWRRLIDAHRMPEGARVTEVRLTGDETPMTTLLGDSEFAAVAYTMLAAIDWHSQITLSLSDCDGGAGWSRNARQITLCDGYIERFSAQLAD